MENKRSNVIGAISIILCFIAIQGVSFLSILLLANQPPAYQLYTVMAINLLGAFGALWLNYHFNITYTFEKRSKLFDLIKWGISGTIMSYLVQVLIISIEITLFGEPSVSANTESIIQTISSNPLFILLPIISAPIIEELVFRKAINGLLVDKIGWIGAAVISSLLFAIVHFDGLILTYAAMGLILSYVYHQSNNIWGPILAHMGFNLFATLMNLLL